MKYYIYSLLIVLVLLIGCATEDQSTGQETISEPQENQPAETTIEAEEPTMDEIIKIPNDIKEILEKGKTKLTSYSYNYKSPESELVYQIYVKGNNIKIILPDMNTQEAGKLYNTIYIDTEKKTAQAYCIGYSSCASNVGKIKDLNYETTYIKTPLDWLEKVTQANEIDQRQFEGRKAIYLETNIGKITVESHYGFLYKIEDDKKKWEFTDVAFDSVKDSDVIPS